jgi:hypothetical protein
MGRRRCQWVMVVTTTVWMYVMVISMMSGCPRSVRQYKLLSVLSNDQVFEKPAVPFQLNSIV